MREARPQRARPADEAIRDGGARQREDDEVEDVDEFADRIETCECVRLVLR